jgi:hypothetical protein
MALLSSLMKNICGASMGRRARPALQWLPGRLLPVSREPDRPTVKERDRLRLAVAAVLATPSSPCCAITRRSCSLFFCYLSFGEFDTVADGRTVVLEFLLRSTPCSGVDALAAFGSTAMLY